MDHTLEQNVLMRLAEAWQARDAGEVAACFTEDGVYVSSVETAHGYEARGRSEIERLVSSMFQHDRTARSSTTAPVIDGDRASWLWEYEDYSGGITRGCDFFEFEGGKICRKDAYRKVSIS